MKIIHIVVIFVSVMLIVGTIAYIMIKNTDEKYTNNEQNIINKINTMTFDELLSTDLYFDANQLDIENIKDKLYEKFRNKFKEINNIEDYDYSIRGDINIPKDKTLTKTQCKEYNDSIGHTWEEIDDSTKPPGCFVSYGEKKIKWNSTDTSKSCTPDDFCIRKRKLTKLNDSKNSISSKSLYNIVKTISLKNYNGVNVTQKYGYSVKHTANGIFCPYINTDTEKMPSYIDGSNIGDYILIVYATVSRDGQAIDYGTKSDWGLATWPEIQKLYGKPEKTKKHNLNLGSMRALQNPNNKKQYILYNITSQYIRIIRIEISVTSDNKLRFVKILPKNIGNQYYSITDNPTFVYDGVTYPFKGYEFAQQIGYKHLDEITLQASTPGQEYLVDNITFKILPRTNEISTSLPLYIYLHGGSGGGAKQKKENEIQFNLNRADKYIHTYDIEPAIIVSLRAANDTGMIHYSPNSYSLLDKIIIYFSCKFNVNLNRVYILGLSAGGDGVYNLSVRMPDLFAATHMSAGHSNNVSLKNLKNLPIYLTIGVFDNGYNRISNVIANYNQLKNLKYTTELSILVHNVKKTYIDMKYFKSFFIKDNVFRRLQNMYYSLINEKETRIISHFLPENNSIPSNYAYKKMIWKVNDINTFKSNFDSFNVNILNNTNVKYGVNNNITQYTEENKIAIRSQYFNDIAYERDIKNQDNALPSLYLDYFRNKFKTDVIKDNIIVDDIDDIRQVNKHSRSAYPDHIVLDGYFNNHRQWTPGSEFSLSDTITKRNLLNYWLDFSISDSSKIGAFYWGNNNPIEAKITEKNIINITLPDNLDKVRVLLKNDNKMDLSKEVYINGLSYTPRPNLKIMVRTLLERGDKDYIFLDQYDYDKNNTDVQTLFGKRNKHF